MSEVHDDRDLEESPPAAESPPAGPAGIPARVLAWTAANRLKAVLLSGACLISVILAAVLWSVSVKAPVEKRVTIKMAFSALDRGNYAAARRYGGTLQREEADSPKASTQYVLGAALIHEADRASTAAARGLYLRAAKHLEEARRLGFPANREADGLFLLGRALHRGARIADSRPVLHEALAAAPQRGADIHRLLAEGYLNEPNPNYRDALEENTLYLADRTVDPSGRRQALLDRSWILLRMGKLEDAKSTLDQVSADTDLQTRTVLLRSEIILEEARRIAAPPAAAAVPPERQAKLDQAIALCKEAQRTGSTDEAVLRRASYLAGMARLELGDQAKALEELGHTARTWPGTPEALAADFRVGQLTQQLQRDAESALAYRRALDAVQDAASYSNPWLPLNELQKRTLDAYRRFMESAKFDNALQLARHMVPVISATEAVEFQAEAYRAWSHALVEEAAKQPVAEAATTTARARRLSRSAGRAYADLARLRILTRNYAEDLWASAECSLEGHGYRDAVAALELYLENESRRRRPRALVNLGEALLALGENEKALTALEECIEFYATDAAAYQARLLASAAHANQGGVREAETLLQANLNGFLTPQSTEWRDSLFALGFLLASQERDDEAIPRLDEAVERYPDAPQTIEALYQVGQCCRRGAEAVRARIENDPVEAARLAGAKRALALLAAAVDRYRLVQANLNRRNEAAELTELEARTLRNSYFAIGASLFDLGQYDEAIRAYTAAASRYQNYPEALEAYVQISRAYRRLGRPDRVRGTLEQARVLLSRMKQNAAFGATTIYDEVGWSELLGSMETM